MIWLGMGQGFGLMMAIAILHSEYADAANTFLHFWSPKSRKHLITPELLQRLGINGTTEASRWFHFLKSAVKVYGLLWYWPYALICRFFDEEDASKATLLFSSLVYGTPAIWGFVIIINMLRDYGNCIRVY